MLMKTHLTQILLSFILVARNREAVSQGVIYCRGMQTLTGDNEVVGRRG